MEQKEQEVERRETFMVHVVSRENATWQGHVTWLDKEETRSFRSLLELIKLIDTALEDKEMDQCIEKGEEV